MQCISNKSYASVVPRAMAYLIDTLCVALASGAIFGVIKSLNIYELNKGILFNYSIIAIATYIFKKFYFIVLTANVGQTLGKMCFRIKVVNNDGSKVSIWNVIYRETIGRYLTEVVCFLGYLGVLISEQKKGIHDWLCDTCVVYDEHINNEKVYYIPPKQNNNMYQYNGMTPVMNNANGVNQVSPVMNNINMVNPIPPVMNNVGVGNEMTPNMDNSISYKETFTESDISNLTEEVNSVVEESSVTEKIPVAEESVVTEEISVTEEIAVDEDVSDKSEDVVDLDDVAAINDGINIENDEKSYIENEQINDDTEENIEEFSEEEVENQIEAFAADTEAELNKDIENIDPESEFVFEQDILESADYKSEELEDLLKDLSYNEDDENKE